MVAADGAHRRVRGEPGAGPATLRTRRRRARVPLAITGLLAAAPAVAAGSDFGGQVATMLGALALVVVCILGAARLVRRFGLLPFAAAAAAPGRAPVLRVVASLGVGARERAVLVDVDGQRLLLGVAPGRVQLLHVAQPPPTGPAEVAAPAGTPPVAFGAELARAEGR
jgi:flagellar protein FliO/FliZ